MRKTSRTTSLPIRPSSEWVKAAPKEATALIVAECSVDHQVASRRIGLGWMNGSRTDVSHICTAATRFPETAAMLETAESHAEADGAACLCSPVRCKTRWTIRSIPIGLLSCWVGYEDALNAPSQPIPVPVEVQVPLPTARKEIAANIQPLKKELAASTLPLKKEVPARKAASAAPVANEVLPVFAPLAALILNRKDAFRGNCAAPDGMFITDGVLMLKRAACDAHFQSKLKAVTVNGYGPENPLPDDRSQTLFDSTVREAKHDATIRGYILGASAEAVHEAEMPLVCIQGPAGRVTVVNGHKLLLIQAVTGATRIRQTNEQQRRKVVLCKDDEPVAVMMAIDDQSVEELFQKMLATEQPRATVSSIAPAARRIAG